MIHENICKELSEYKSKFEEVNLKKIEYSQKLDIVEVFIIRTKKII